MAQDLRPAEGLRCQVTPGEHGYIPIRYIHDELWGVALDAQENFLMLGGSGDEYSYSATLNGWSSDVWVS